ncbi:hypothetical protein VNO77_10406 [Canavalia gladiata]|uniref:FAF domain-containing protein n=1 Tax=Canavalia gladiata TaxID=3824 RepID=A0AAN9MAZ4_CANGL
MMTTSNGDEYIGTESCIDLQNDLVLKQSEISKRNGAVKMSNSKKKEKRELPPPIPHMARVLRRYYTTDGRLIIKEEKVNHQQYFRAHRANGCLTLHLVPLDHESREVKAAHEPSQNIIIDTDELPMENVTKGGSSSNCLNCNRVRSPSCIFRVPALKAHKKEGKSKHSTGQLKLEFVVSEISVTVSDFQASVGIALHEA